MKNHKRFNKTVGKEKVEQELDKRYTEKLLKSFRRKKKYGLKNSLPLWDVRCSFEAEHERGIASLCNGGENGFEEGGGRVDFGL